MEILNKSNEKTGIGKPEIETVEQEEKEYKLIGRFLRRKGLRLFEYNPAKDELKELIVESKRAVEIQTDADGRLTVFDLSEEETAVDSRNIQFEALNIKNAKKRLKKYKDGKIKVLCNLRKPGKGIIIF